jgi:D-glycero-D-manno-heptose 1,7-bisphosphate phosphatase
LSRPELSVIIATAGRDTVIRAVESVLEAAGEVAIEVLVVGHVKDPRAAAELAGIIARRPAVRHVAAAFSNGDASRKRNLGARLGKGELVAFIDDDVVVEAGWARRIVDSFRDPEVAVVGGPGIVPEDIDIVGRLIGMALASRATGYLADRYRHRPTPPKRVRGSRIIGCNLAFRRQPLEAVGFYDHEFWPGEEILTVFEVERAGGAIVFDPQAVVHHYPRQTLRGFWRQIHSYGRTRIRLFRRGVRSDPLMLLPLPWLAVALLLTVTAPVSDFARQLFTIGVVGYALAVALIGIHTAIETRRTSDLLLAAVVPFMHLAYALGQWRELLLPGRRPTNGDEPADGSRDRLVILDRDGVINYHVDGYVRSPDDWRPIPGSLAAIARLKQRGFKVAVATNQSAVARGIVRPADLDAIHHHMRIEVEHAGGRIDAVAVCPHVPEDDCGCRKPRPGLLHELGEQLGRELGGVPFIGDRPSDVAAARAAGCRPVLVRSGREAAAAEKLARADGIPIFDDLAAATDHLLATD